MKLHENFKLALIALLANKMRTFMTMLGIIIGIASVIAIVNVGDAMSAQQAEQMKKIGFGTLSISVQAKEMEDYGFSPSIDLVTREQIKEYQKKFSEYVDSVSYYEWMDNSKIKKQGKAYELCMCPANEGYRKEQNLDLIAGSDLDDKDIEKKHYVCLISNTFVKKYFNKTDPSQVLGKTLTVPIGDASKDFTIIGVFDGDISESYGSAPRFIFPITIHQEIKGLPSGIQSFTIKPKDNIDQELFANTTIAYWKSIYKNNKTTELYSYDGNQYVKQQEESYNQSKMAMGAIGAISLLVGGIGVMNIMMVSVTERTREIGIRMALGAKTSEILLQFIIEAIVICLIGGIIGILIGSMAGMAISNTMYQYSVYPSLFIILGSLGFSMLVGIFFGYYPAKKASDMDPIDALRYE